MLAFYLSAVIMICQWGRLFSRVLILRAKTRMVKAKNTVAWIKIPEFEELASEMKIKLHKKQPFGILLKRFIWVLFFSGVKPL
jgi:hypothetical protein